MPVIKIQNQKIFLATILQISLILMVATIALKPLIESWVFYAAEILLSAIYLKILFFDLKKYLKTEHKYSLYFFGPLVLFIQGAWILQAVFPIENNYLYFFGTVIALFLFAAIYRIAFGKKYTNGKVLLSNQNLAVIQTDFDIQSFTTEQKHIIETDKRLKEGETVKIQIKKDFFGKKTAKITEE